MRFSVYFVDVGNSPLYCVEKSEKIQTMTEQLLFDNRLPGSHSSGHRMHQHSLVAHREEKLKLAGRKLEIYQAFVLLGSMTDRECRDYLGYRDMNCVRPRITELIKDDYLVELRLTYDVETKRQVRLVGVKR